MSFDLPENWEITTIGEVILPYKTIQPQKESSKEFLYIDISSIDNANQIITNPKKFLGKDAPSRARRVVKKGDILFSTVRTYLKNIARVPAELDNILTSTGIAVLRTATEVDSSFLFYIVSSDKFIHEISSAMDGTLYPAVTDNDIAIAKIPLPPLNEQKRIVAKIEALQERSQRVKTELDAIKPLLDQFRQSVLAAAFRGDLTADWRENHPDVEPAEVLLEAIEERRLNQAATPAQKKILEKVYSYQEDNESDLLPNGWRYVVLEKVCESFQYGTSQKSDQDGKVPVLRMGNLQNGSIDWNNLVYTSEEKEIEKYFLKPYTVLFNRTNSPELVGKTSIYRGEHPAIFAGYLIKINNYPELNPEFLNYALNTKYAKLYCWKVKTDGVSQSNINAQKLSKFEIPFCSIQEQKEIVRRIESLFKLANTIANQKSQIQNNLETLNQSILAKAFRGELVPQDPNDEPASVLLERIRQEKAKTQPTKRQTNNQKISNSNVTQLNLPGIS